MKKSVFILLISGLLNLAIGAAHPALAQEEMASKKTASCEPLDASLANTKIIKLLMVDQSSVPWPKVIGYQEFHNALHSMADSYLRPCLETIAGGTIAVRRNDYNFIDTDFTVGVESIINPNNLIITFLFGFSLNPLKENNFQVCTAFFKPGLTEFEQFRMQRASTCRNWNFDSEEDFQASLKRYFEALRLPAPVKKLHINLQ